MEDLFLQEIYGLWFNSMRLIQFSNHCLENNCVSSDLHLVFKILRQMVNLINETVGVTRALARRNPAT